MDGENCDSAGPSGPCQEIVCGKQNQMSVKPFDFDF